jgi:hypothetical protein
MTSAFHHKPVALRGVTQAEGSRCIAWKGTLCCRKLNNVALLTKYCQGNEVKEDGINLDIHNAWEI